MRKGNAEKADKVKLTMLDISAKYDRDYSIKVIDKFSFSEKVQNKNVSKSVEEYMRSNEFEEYNYSDAIVDGSIKSEDIMTDEEKENYKMSDEEKEKVINDTKKIMDEYGMEGDIEEIDNPTAVKKDIDDNILEPKFNNGDDKEDTTQSTEAEEDEDATKEKIQNNINDTNNENNQIKEDLDEQRTTSELSSIDNNENNVNAHINGENTNNEDENSKEKTTEATTEEVTEQSDIVSGFTNTESEESTKESTIYEKTTEETTTESQTTEETTTEAQTTEETTTEAQTTEETTTKEQTTIKGTKINDAQLPSTSKLISEEDITNNIVDSEATSSEIVYGDEIVEFEIAESTISNTSLKEAYEEITGKKSDRKHIIPNRSVNEFLPNPNSLNDLAFMNDNIEVVEEELKSAYVILDFKERQSEKIIEISIKNDNKYRGSRQVAFKLSSVDDSPISGIYSSLTLIIQDDEEVVPSYINFTKANFEPNDGYLTVTIERSGDSSSIATCMIDSEDITAVCGRDYSKVHAELMFGLGVSIRTVKIPVVSKFVKHAATFKLKLQEAKGALIGNNGTTICTIKDSDASFKYAPINKTENENKLFGNGTDVAKNNLVPVENAPNEKLFGAGGRDYDLDSIILGDSLNLEKIIKNFKSKKANKSSNHYFMNGGKGFHMYLENHDVFGESAYYTFNIDTAELGYRYDWSGVQFNWTCNHNADIELEEWMNDTNSWRRFYEVEDTGWSGTRADNFMLQNDNMTNISFWLRREGGLYGKSPTINIESIQPILKMYKISLIGSTVPELINDDGISTSTNKYSHFAITSLDGAKSDHTAVGWTGKTITVKLDNTVNNPFYIKRLLIKTSETGGEWMVVSQNYDTEATTISFEMDEGFATKYKDFINRIDRPGGGYNGEFKLQAELATKQSLVKVEKDNRVDVKIWGTTPQEITDESDNWTYNIGDVLHFTAEVKPEFQEMFECNGLNIYRLKPYSPDWLTIRKPLTGDNYYPLDLEYSEIKVVPILSKTNNLLIVKVPKNKLSLFDTSYGIFTKTRYEGEDFYEYYIETDSSKISGNYFELKARCLSDNNVPIWFENHKDNIMYTQNTYFFLASTEPDDNIVYLTCDAADDRNYSIEGTAYY